MERMFALIAAAGLWLTPPALAQSPVPDVAAALPAVPADPGDELALEELDLRMTVPVTIAGKGAWPFVIDTGAERTVVSTELAASLGLAPGPSVRVTTMASTLSTPTARVPLLKVSRLSPDLIEAPVYARRFIGAAGMLGLDALQGQRVVIDFDRSNMTLTPARRRMQRPAASDEIVIVAKSRFGQLIVTDAHWRGKRVAVVIDTGSPVTIANSALLRLAKSSLPIGPISMIAASGETLVADVHQLDRLEIGGVTFSGVGVAVADVIPFGRFGLADKPALLLGMETLRMFRSVEIDFTNRTIRLALPRNTLRRGTSFAAN